MKAYLIDPTIDAIVETEYNGDWKTIAPTIGAETFTLVVYEHNGVELSIYVDDEGLFNGNPHGWFDLPGFNQAFRGKGLVLGTDDEGESVDVPDVLEHLLSAVSFPDTASVRAKYG